jgi:hypothetical protein
MRKVPLTLWIAVLTLTLTAQVLTSPTGVSNPNPQDGPNEESYMEGGRHDMGLSDMQDESPDHQRDHLANTENDALAKALTNQYFSGPSRPWTMFDFFPIGVQFFVRDSWDHFQTLEKKFLLEGRGTLKDWELGTMATAHILKNYLTEHWVSDLTVLSSAQCAALLDMDKFDTWAEKIDPALMNELEQYIPALYSSRPSEPEGGETQYLTDEEDILDADSPAHREMPLDWDTRDDKEDKFSDEMYSDL